MKFQKGDKVKVLTNTSAGSYFKKGDIITVIKVEERSGQEAIHADEDPNYGRNFMWAKDAELVSRVGEKPISKKKKKAIDLVDIRRHGKEIILPPDMNYDAAIEVLTSKKTFEEQIIDINETIDNAFVWDGAIAMVKAMERLYGFAKTETVEHKGFFGTTIVPPKTIAVESGVNEVSHVPWGRFSLPGMEGHIDTGLAEKDGQAVFAMSAHIKRKYETAVHELAELTRKIVKEESIYRGKAIKIRFEDENGSKLPMPMPKFVDTSHVKEDEVLFSDVIRESVATNLYVPIEKSQECKKHGIPLKRGILLSGPYGTGKTLVAYTTAAKCIKNGWTFLYVEKADELLKIVNFAKQYQPAVVFCEDIDRIVTGERDIDMDSILNIIDGIESKHTDLMVILTTNHAEKINKAMLRPGRLDAVINLTPPDAGTVVKLLNLYGRGLIKEGEDLSKAGEILQNRIPAVIRECVERAKLCAIKNHSEGDFKIDSTDIINAALGMKNQLDLLEAEQAKDTDPEHMVGKVLFGRMVEIISKQIKPLKGQLDEIQSTVEN